MAATKLGLYELLTPQFLAGFTFPPHVDKYLAFLSVDELRTAFDDAGIVYSGRVSFGGEGEAAPRREHKDPGGGFFRWDDVAVDFRLTLPRDGAAFINTAADALAVATLPDFDQLFDQMGAVEQAPAAPTEYPGVRFRLELMLQLLIFHLPRDKWVPGEVGPDFKIRPSTDPEHAGQEVKFILPKVVLVYEQGDDLTRPPEFRLASWGSGGFDAPHDLRQGELVRMEPPIALHDSERFAFAVDQVSIDLSEDHTPPEILQFFGTDEAFQGVYVRSARLFYLDKGKDFGFNIGVNDLLVSTKGEISLEAFAHIFANTPLTVFNVEVRFYNNGADEIDYTKGKKERDGRAITITGSEAKVPQTALAQLEITGGVPEYTISVTIDGVEVWDGTRRDARISPDMPATLRSVGEHTMVVTVIDEASPGDAHTFTQTIKLIVTPAQMTTPAADQDGSELDRPPALGERQAAELTIDAADLPLPQGCNLRLVLGSQSETETIAVEGGESARVIIRDGASTLVDRTLAADNRLVSVLCPHDKSLTIEVQYPTTTTPQTEVFELFFGFDKPKKSGTSAVSEYVSDRVTDGRFHGSAPPSGSAATPSKGAANLKKWIQDRLIAPRQVTITASASAEGDSSHNLSLSERRKEAAKLIAEAASATVTSSQGIGEVGSTSDSEPLRELNRVALIEGVVGNPLPGKTIHATLSRPERPAPEGEGGGDPGGGAEPQPIIKPSGRPPDVPTDRPPYLRRLSFRIRLERGDPVLVEISGEVDFETEAEKKLRAAGVDTGSVALKQLPAAVPANENPADGVVIFKLLVTYDTATRQLSESLFLGASPDDKNGLLRLEAKDTDSTGDQRIKNIVGAVLVFAPVINEAASALEPDSAGDWAKLAIALGVPIAIGSITLDGAFIFQTRSVTLYGGELRFRQFLPAGEDPLRFTDAGVIFDYDVEFRIEIRPLDIKTKSNLKVRYRAVGFNLHFENGVTYEPIFDTSRGYEIDLSDPGLFDVAGPLGSILTVLGVRVARFNPLTFELDLGLKVDLGVVTVDRFKIKWPLDPLDVPSILPTGIKVHIPATLIGEGRAMIVDQEVNGVAQKGVLGSLDVTVVPLEIRIAASLGVIAMEDVATRRQAIAVFAGLIAEFPTPILLWSTGLGLYGFSGLFAMHFKRTEPAPVPGDSVSPALHWLVKAEGEPAKLFNSLGEQLWAPDFDRWAFGVGLILGTVEGGFLINFRGMFVLELPGPRILIFVKVQVIELLPALPDQGLTTGILGVIDLDFNLGQLTIGILIDMKIQSIVEIKIPIEIFFKFDNPRDWHLYIGTISAPASAKVLNLVQARGYFMIDGKDITPFPPAIAGNAAGPGLPGIAVAVGLDASVIFGSTDVGLYLRVSAGAHMGVSFADKLFVTGIIYLDGELRLFIVSIGATGTLNVKAPNPTLISGEVCGKVSFFFFSVKGCVRVNIGSGSHNLPAPDLVNGVFLQSHAPVIAAGQGGERPIDASLGAALDAATNPPDDKLPVVPIDSLPVIQFFCAPRITDGGTSTTTFTRPLTTPPNLTTGGWVDIGGGRQARYLLRAIALTPGIFVPTGVADPLPPATWRRDVAGPGGANTSVDLALFSTVPMHGERALERSTDNNSKVTIRWGDLCKPVAPPVCVLWTFCGQAIGPSGQGWTLTGIPAPDPPGTIRHTPPLTTLPVLEPELTEAQEQANLLGAAGQGQFLDPARVIGGAPAWTRPAREICAVFTDRRPVILRRRLVDNGITFDADADLRITTIRGITGLGVARSIVVRLPQPASGVTAELLAAGQQSNVRMEAFAGPRLRDSVTRRLGRSAETLTLRGDGIDRVVVTAAETLILRFCFAPEREPRLRAECFRALQLPCLGRIAEEVNVPRAPEATALQADLAKRRWIDLATGAAKQARLYLASSSKLRERIFVVQFDAAGNVVADTSIFSMGPILITGTTTGLPASWLAAPWSAEVLPVATFLAAPEIASMDRLLVTIKPSEKTVRLRVEIRGPAGDERVILAVAEVCSKAEADRAEQDQLIQTGEIETVTGYLAEAGPVPLLVPNKKYKLTLTYDAELQGEGIPPPASPAPPPRVQEFLFRTDALPPPRLDARVLATTPDADEQFHFFEDPLKVVFNDLATIQLYQAYGRKLRARLRAADGVPNPEDEVTTLEPVVTGLSTPLREFLQSLVEAGLFPCVGEITIPSHGSYSVPIPLRPVMGYTFDIEPDPPLPAPAGAPTVPLFRRQFRTGRFPSPAALVADLREQVRRHRALTGPIAGLPAGAPLTPGGAPVAAATDKELFDAMMAAGEQPLPGPAISGLTIYWVPRTGGGFAPHAILIDAAEPLWRTRLEPALETVPLQSPPNDPAFQRVVLRQALALEVTASPPSAVQRFVRSTSGTRTLVFLNPALTIPAAGLVLSLALHRPASALFVLPNEVIPMIDLTLKPSAPWEDDHE